MLAVGFTVICFLPLEGICMGDRITNRDLVNLIITPGEIKEKKKVYDSKF